MKYSVSANIEKDGMAQNNENVIFSFFPQGYPLPFMVAETPVTDMDLQAFVDDGLNSDKRRAVMIAILQSPVLLERVDELLQQKKLLQEYWSMYRRSEEH